MDKPKNIMKSNIFPFCLVMKEPGKFQIETEMRKLRASAHSKSQTEKSSCQGTVWKILFNKLVATLNVEIAFCLTHLTEVD